MQIKNIFISFIIIATIISNAHASFFSPLIYQSYAFTIMIDPAGDAQIPGRTIENCYERSITLLFANQLKNILEQRYNGLHCIISRQAGDIIAPLQNANYANRMNVDLYISIHFYQESQPKPNLSLYTFSNNDDFISLRSELHFYPFDQIHQINGDQTKKWSLIILQSLCDESCKKLFNCQNIMRIPFKPLVGIKAPAIAFEFGLKTKDDWQQFIEPLAMSLHTIITKKI